jgi:hypothetical protein
LVRPPILVSISPNPAEPLVAMPRAVGVALRPLVLLEESAQAIQVLTCVCGGVSGMEAVLDKWASQCVLGWFIGPDEFAKADMAANQDMAQVVSDVIWILGASDHPILYAAPSPWMCIVKHCRQPRHGTNRY